MTVIASTGDLTIQVDSFDQAGPDTFVNRSGDDEIVGVLNGDLFPSPAGLVDLTARIPELAGRRVHPPIDIVYTWVNNNDTDWLRLFHRAERGVTSDDSISDSRFHSNDELRFSLRSVHMHMPWVRSIHVVSNCSPPAWLRVEHPQLQWVPHEAILPPDCLPTFNSHAIETSLHRVPGLSENFVYFNDDFFAFRPLTPRLFVNENGTLNANLERQAVVSSSSANTSPDYLNAARNSADLLYERFGYYPTRLHCHAPYSLRRSLLAELEAEFEDSFQRTRKARFRSASDISVASFLAHHYGFVKGMTTYASYPSMLVKSNDPFVLLNLRNLKREAMMMKVVCINEGGMPEPTTNWRRAMSTLMAQAFCVPSPWER